MNFRKRVLIIVALSGLIELLILAAAGYTYIVNTQETELGLEALGISNFLSRSPYIQEMLQTGTVSEEDQLRYRNLSTLVGAAFISIGDADGVRLVHPVDDRIGKPMVGGDNYRALIGGESYISVATGSLGKSVRGKSAVRGENGTILGVVSVGYLLNEVKHRNQPFLVYLVFVTLFIVTLNILICYFIFQRYQKQTLGFELSQVRQQDVLLDTILKAVKDGVIVSDSSGMVVFVNEAACVLLDINEKQAGDMLLEHLLPNSDVDTLFESGQLNQSSDLRINSKLIEVSSSLILVDEETVGAISVLRLK